MSAPILVEKGMKPSEAESIVIIGYCTVLNRQPDKSGMEYWKPKLMSGEITEDEFVASLFSSDEYKKNSKKK